MRLSLNPKSGRVVFEEIENFRKNGQKVKKVPSCEVFLRP